MTGLLYGQLPREEALQLPTSRR